MCKENQFYSLPFGKLELAFTCPNVISTSLKNILSNRVGFTVLLLFKFLKKHHLPTKLKTEFTGPIAKSTSPGLSDTTFFACCSKELKIAKWKHNKQISHKGDSLQMLIFNSSKYQIKFFQDPHNPLGTIFCPYTRQKNNYSGTPLIGSPISEKNLAVLMGDRINNGFFTRKRKAILPGGQKTKWP